MEVRLGFRCGIFSMGLDQVAQALLKDFIALQCYTVEG